MSKLKQQAWEADIVSQFPANIQLLISNLNVLDITSELDDNGNNIVDLAIIHGLTNVIQKLPNYGFKLDTPNNKGIFPLHKAIIERNHAILIILLDDFKLDPNVRSNDMNNKGWLPLDYAMWSYNETAFEILVKRGALVREENGACWLPVIEDVQSMVMLTEVESPTIASRVTAINKMYSIAEAQDMIDQELVTCTYLGDIDGIKEAIRKGANVNCYDRQYIDSFAKTPYEIALSLEDSLQKSEIVALLTSLGAKPLVDRNNYRYVFNYRDLKYKDNVGNTKLHYAAATHNHKKGLLVAKILISIGMNVNIQGYNNDTPLHIAAYNSNNDLIRYLLSCKNINLNAVDRNGTTPLMFAAMQNNQEGIKILLEAGADRSIINNEGLTFDDIITKQNKPKSPIERTTSDAENLKQMLVSKIQKDGESYNFLDLNVVKHNYNQIRANIPFLPYIAVKANSAEGILELLLNEGANFEIAGAGELELCMEKGIPGSKILFSHPSKSSDAIAQAYQYGIRQYVSDSETDLELIAQNAPGSSILIRTTTGNSRGENDDKIGFDKRFGVKPENAVGLLKRAQSLGLKPIGLAMHVGTQQEDVTAWNYPIKKASEIFAEAKSQGINLTTLDLGGGFPSRYSKKLPEYKKYGEAISAALSREFQEQSMPKIYIEPGRSISAMAGISIGKVTSVKPSEVDDKKQVVTLSIGRYNAGLYGVGHKVRFYRPNKDGMLEKLSSSDSDSKESAVFGGVCASFDTPLDEGVKLPSSLKPDDIVIFSGTGAYTRQMQTEWCRVKNPNNITFDLLPRSETTKFTDRVTKLDNVLERSDQLKNVSRALSFIK